MLSNIFVFQKTDFNIVKSGGAIGFISAHQQQKI
jgi:hypothetical protein